MLLARLIGVVGALLSVVSASFDVVGVLLGVVGALLNVVSALAALSVLNVVALTPSLDRHGVLLV